jgi:hypothetical protein
MIVENADPNRIIVTESSCHACKIHSFLVHHRTFPEMRMEAMSADRAARQLANRLESALGMVSDPHHRQQIRLAIDDARIFLGREESCARSRCDAQGHHPS